MIRIRVHPLRHAVAGAVLLLAAAATAHAADVYWENPGPLAAGQRAALDLVFDGTEPADAVTLPRIDGLELLGDPSEASSVSIINGRQRSTLTFSYPVRPKHEGVIQVPAFAVETSAGTQTVRPLAVEVGAAAVAGARGAVAVGDVVQARLTPSNMSPYAGEVFDLDMTVALTGGRRGEVAGRPQWTPARLAAEPWGDGAAVRTQGGSGVRFRTRAVASEPGRIEIAPAQQEVQVDTGRRDRVDPLAGFGSFGSLRGFGAADDFFDSFFSRAQMADVTVQSNAVQLDVRPLPQPAPAEFSGAVGQFTLASTLSPAQPTTGEPVTWTLTLSGRGNWPSVTLPARAVPNSLRTLQPKQTTQFASGELFTGSVSEVLVVVPSSPGEYALEPVRFTYFDPIKGTYETAVAQPPILHVTGAPIAPEPQHLPNAAAASLPAAPDSAVHDAATAAAPLPHEPLPGAAVGRVPLPWDVLRGWVAAPFLALFVYALALAIRRAYLNDPLRPQRAAWRQMRAAAERARQAAGAGERIAALLDWQHAATVVLGIDRAAPTAAQMRDVADPRWAQAWAGSERALYGRAHTLPEGWCDAALALCVRPRRTWIRWRRGGSARTLLPRFATAALVAICLARPAAADPLEAYQHGRFDEARTELVARAQAEPADWIARYNLGLVEAQRGDIGHAFGETLAAFAHAPRDAAVRGNASRFASQLPGIERATASLIGGGLAALASPAMWQLVLVAGALLFCLGAALMLPRVAVAVPPGGGRDGRRPSLLVGATLLAAGLAAGASSGLALQRWGAIADPRAAAIAAPAVLRSLPTDATAAAQERPLGSGAVVKTEQEFLGWVRVALDSGETGWLRQGEIVPLYAKPGA
jgi:hypothetical protein